MAITTKEVISRQDLRRFVRFPNELYADNEYYVPQIESMEMDTLTPGKNRAFEVCEGKYWLAYDENDKIVGRVAGIINYKYNKKVDKKICRFCWIDFIESQEVVHALMERVKEYGKEKGMEIIEGPVGFLEFDISGVLVEGFDQLPTAYGKYNAPYYEPMLLKEGFSKETDFVEYKITVPDNLDRYFHFAEMIGERYNLKEGNYKNKNELLHKYADGIFRVMNECYSVLHGFSELSPAQCEDLKDQFFPNLNLDYVSVIVDETDKVVGFGITLPSLSKALQKAKGHMFPFGFIHILKALHHNDTIDALLIAISNEYKDKGVNAMIISKIGRGMHKNGIKYVESTRELEENHNVQNLWGKFEHHLHKRARIYVKNI